jgi:hypothetical protein
LAEDAEFPDRRRRLRRVEVRQSGRTRGLLLPQGGIAQLQQNKQSDVLSKLQRESERSGWKVDDGSEDETDGRGEGEGRVGCSCSRAAQRSAARASRVGLWASVRQFEGSGWLLQHVSCWISPLLGSLAPTSPPYQPRFTTSALGSLR